MAKGLAGFLLVIASQTTATAQPASTFETLATRVKVGQALTITDDAGGLFSWRLVSMTPQQLVVSADKAQTTIRAERVRDVKRCCDSVKNGTLIGAAALGTLGFLGAVRFSGETRIGDGLFGLLMFGGIGAGIGAGVDAAIRRDVIIYRAAAADLRFLPDPRRRAFTVALRF